MHVGVVARVGACAEGARCWVPAELNRRGVNAAGSVCEKSVSVCGVGQGINSDLLCNSAHVRTHSTTSFPLLPSPHTHPISLSHSHPPSLPPPSRNPSVSFSLRPAQTFLVASVRTPFCSTRRVARLRSRSLPASARAASAPRPRGRPSSRARRAARRFRPAASVRPATKGASMASREQGVLHKADQHVARLSGAAVKVSWESRKGFKCVCRTYSRNRVGAEVALSRHELEEVGRKRVIPAVWTDEAECVVAASL